MPKFNRLGLAVALPLVAGLALAGCGSSADQAVSPVAAGESSAAGSAGSAAPAEGSAPAAGEPVRGGNFTWAIISDIGCIDPQQVGNNDAINTARQTVASLTAQSPETGEIVPWLAESWEINDDASEYTFTLIDGATYADGTPIDAESVKVNFEAIQALGAKASLGSTYLVGLKEITVVDPKTVTISFEQPSAQFLQATSTFSLGLLANSSADLSEEDRCAGKFVGSGPFSVRSYTVDQEIVLERRDGYTWGAADVSDHTGEAHLDTVTVKVIPEAGVRTGSLLSGQIDATAAIGTADLPQFDGNGFWLANRANPGVVYNLYPNESRPLLADENVRLAVLKGLNREEITQTVLSPLEKPVTAALAHSTPLYEDISDLLTYDPEGAKQLLEESGWVVGADGIREKDGQKLSTQVTFWQPKEPLELAQQQLRQIGFDLQLNYVSIADATAANASGDYDFSYGNLTRSDPDILRNIFSANSTRNINVREPSEVDDLLDAQASITDPAERQKVVTEASRLLFEQAHSIPVVELSTTIAAADKVQGLTFEGSSRIDFYDVWITS